MDILHNLGRYYILFIIVKILPLMPFFEEHSIMFPASQNQMPYENQ